MIWKIMAAAAPVISLVIGLVWGYLFGVRKVEDVTHTMRCLNSDFRCPFCTRLYKVTLGPEKSGDVGFKCHCGRWCRMIPGHRGQV